MNNKKISISKKLSFRYIDNILRIMGTLGSFSLKINHNIKIGIKDNHINIAVLVKTKIGDFIFRLCYSLINNIIQGIIKKFIKKLVIQGLGYVAEIKHGILSFILGYSHEILYYIPNAVKINCVDNVKLVIIGCNKYQVSQICLNIKNIRITNPYKIKGIRYQNEILLQKKGKKK